MKPKTIITANWKMNLSIGEAQELGTGLDHFCSEANIKDEVVLCPTFLQLPTLSSLVTTVKLGSQDVYIEDNGAFTGEISTEMLKEVHCEYVIVGHSERRHVLLESDEIIKKKHEKVLGSNLKSIFCVGEKIEEREAGSTNQVLQKQLTAFENIDERKMKDVVIAYEPVWAIGSGETATLNDAEEAIKFIREEIRKRYHDEIADSITIQYGGSVNEENIDEFVLSSQINGVLVGGASLDEGKFTKIISAYQK